MKTKDFKSGTKMTKSTSVVPKAEQWGEFMIEVKNISKDFVSKKKYPGLKRVVKGLFTNEKYLEKM